MVWMKSPNADRRRHMELKSPCFKIDNFSDEYRVQCKIGEGTFSEVLKCVDRHSGISIAAKQLKRSFRSAALAEELPELIAMRKLTRHPNILHMIESHFDKEIGKVTLVFELMDMSLYDLIRNRKKCIPETKAKHYLYQIVKGIDHIHHHGIFHRDIKPENILIKGDSLKISDLGSIKGIYTKQPYTEYISTRWYRSPECLLTAGFYGPKMDVWAIGCVFFELLTLKPLFAGSSEVDQIARIHNILGTPNPRLMAKFRRHKMRNCTITFPTKQGTGLNTLIPFISDNGREVLKQMIVYDPESRINIRRLVEHKYFEDMRYFDRLTMINTAKKRSSNSKVVGVQKKVSKNTTLVKKAPSNEDPSCLNMRTGPGDWKSESNSYIKLKERLGATNYQGPPPPNGGVGEANSIQDRIKEMKSAMEYKNNIENSNQYYLSRLPPLLHEEVKKTDPRLLKVPSRTIHKEKILAFRSSMKK